MVPTNTTMNTGGRTVSGAAATSFGLMVAMALTACASASARPPLEHPSGNVLYVGPTFWSAEDDAPDYAAIEVGRDGRIVALHEAVPRDGARRQVRLPGALALPGLHDAHLHLTAIGRQRETVDLRGATSIAEAARRVEAFADAHPALPVVLGNGWDQTRFASGRYPTASALAGIGRPVILWRVDGHAVWLNPAALARITSYVAAHGEAGDAVGERILVDSEGLPSGVIVDPSGPLSAMFPRAPEGPDDLRRWLGDAANACADAGLVEVTDMGTTLAQLEALTALDRAEALPITVNVYLRRDDAPIAWLEGHPPGPVAVTPRVVVHGVKLFADGALGSRGAALKAPYADEPGHSGQPQPLEPLRAAARRTHDAGHQLAIHAIGDLGNAHALDLIAEVQGAQTGARHRIEHAQVIDPADIDRFAALGVIASMQPTHATSDMRWAEQRLGADRMAGAYAWHTLADRGIPLAFGSDAPIEAWDPLEGIFAAVARTDREGAPKGGWRPGERLSAGAAVRAFSRGAAYAVGADADRGRLAPGQRLRLTVLDRDPRADPTDWLSAAVTATVTDHLIRAPRPTLP